MSRLIDWEPTPEWMHDAACRGVDPALFFPQRGEPQDEAKAVCAGCPVREACLEYAIPEKHGVWGGASERERRVLRRVRNTGSDLPAAVNRPSADCGTVSGYNRHLRHREPVCAACRAAERARSARRRAS